MFLPFYGVLKGMSVRHIYYRSFGDIDLTTNKNLIFFYLILQASQIKANRLPVAIISISLFSVKMCLVFGTQSCENIDAV